MGDPRERWVFLADNLGDVALAVTIEPQIIGAVLGGAFFFSACVLGPALDCIPADAEKLRKVIDLLGDRQMRKIAPSRDGFFLFLGNTELLAMGGVRLDGSPPNLCVGQIAKVDGCNPLALLAFRLCSSQAGVEDSA